MSKKIALITPYSSPEDRGNAVTVRRIEKNLRKIGTNVELFGLDTLTAEEIADRVAGGKFDLCHAFHAYQGGNVARLVAIKTGLPFVVTLTGSDVNEALTDHRREDVIVTLQEAAVVVTFHDSISKRLLLHLPYLASKTRVVPQGVYIPTGSPPEVLKNEFIFLLPAGLRPVKNVLFPLEPLSQLSKKLPSIRFSIAGPILDKDYASEVITGIRNYPFASYSGAVEHQEIFRLYQRCGAVLNCSSSEGGMANSLLEAMACKKPVLVSSIEGNISLVKDGINGLVYEDAEDFMVKAELLMTSEKLRLKLVENAFLKIVADHDPMQEAMRYVEIYRTTSG